MLKIFRFGFSQKLLLSMLLVGLAPLLLTSWLLTDTSSQGLERQVLAQLDSVREIRRKQIEDYFEVINSQIITMAENDMVVEAIQKFESNFNKLLPPVTNEKLADSIEKFYRNQFGKKYSENTGDQADLQSLLPLDQFGRTAQYLYISNNNQAFGEKYKLDSADDGSEYSETHKKYHPKLRNFLEKFGYYDIFLVDVKKGDVVYSVFKEIDFATNLNDGIHRDSGLGRAYRASVGAKNGSTSILDFDPYLPSYESSSSFISSPIYKGNKQVGVLIFQMPVDRINHITKDATGLGETGETYLVGDDLLMRSQSRFSETATLGVLRVDTESSRAAISGVSGSDMVTDYRGVEVLSSHAPLSIDGLNWAIMAEMDKSEAFQTLDKLFELSILMAGACVLAIVGISWLVISGTMKQLGADPILLGEVAQAIAEDKLDIQLQRDGSVGVYRRMIDMRDMLQQRVEAEREVASENMRIKTAVDNATNNILFADDELVLTYHNESFLRFLQKSAREFEKTVSGFNIDSLMGSSLDAYHSDSAAFRSQVLSLTTTSHFDVRFGDLNIRITATPVFNDAEKRIGTVTEWSDRTQQIQTESEIQQIVSGAQLGDLSKRICLENKESFFRRLSEGVNSLISVCDFAIADTVKAVNELSRGNLGYSITAEYNGAFGELKDGVNETCLKLTEVMGKIATSAETVRVGGNDIAAGNSELSQRTETQAANLEETASSMEEIYSTIRQNADNMGRAKELAIGTREQAIEGGKVVSDAITAMSDITRSSGKISEIISVIDEIAFQTNLLALNASVEAARAGETGRGFAVVAEEVRNLASRSALAANEIKELIEDSAEKVDQGAKLVDRSGQSLSSIVESITGLSVIISEISSASDEQREGVGQVNLAVSQMDQMTQQNAGMVEEAAAAAESLSGQAVFLTESVGFFQLSQNYNTGTERQSDDLYESKHPDSKVA